MPHLNFIDRHGAGQTVAAVRVQYEDALEPAVDQALQYVHEHACVGVVADADGARKPAMVLRCAEPQHRQEYRCVAQGFLCAPQDLIADHRISEKRQMTAVLFHRANRHYDHFTGQIRYFRPVAFPILHGVLLVELIVPVEWFFGRVYSES